MASAHPHPVVPVADLDCSTSSKYSEAEIVVRNKLASLYRLIDLNGWSDGIYGHTSARVPSTDNEFVINPFGFLPHEITASSLVKVDIDGEIIDNGLTRLGINKAGYTLHSAIYSSRHDIHCIIHVHTRAGAAVSCMKCGLLPITQDALLLGEIAYHKYGGIVVAQNEKEELAQDLGEQSKILMLQNHGLVALGSTIDEAFSRLRLLVNACEFQVDALAAGLENIVMPGVDSETTVAAAKVGSNDFNWGRGELEWEAEMRKLDLQGYKTGQIYKTASFISTPSAVAESRKV